MFEVFGTFSQTRKGKIASIGARSRLQLPSYRLLTRTQTCGRTWPQSARPLTARAPTRGRKKKWTQSARLPILAPSANAWHRMASIGAPPNFNTHHLACFPVHKRVEEKWLQSARHSISARITWPALLNTNAWPKMPQPARLPISTLISSPALQSTNAWKRKWPQSARLAIREAKRINEGATDIPRPQIRRRANESHQENNFRQRHLIDKSAPYQNALHQSALTRLD